MTVRGVPELSQQPVPDPVGLPEAYSEAGHKGQEAGESAGRPHPYFAPPDLARLSPPRVLGDRLGARYLSLPHTRPHQSDQVPAGIKWIRSAPSPCLAAQPPRRPAGVHR